MPLAAREVAGEDGGAEAERRCRWRCGSRRPRRAPAITRRHGAEQLLVVGRHARAHAGEHRRRVEGARALRDARRRAAAARPRATLVSTCSCSSSRRSRRACGPTSIAVARAGRPPCARACARRTARSNARAHRLHDDEALGGDAALAAVDQARGARRSRPRPRGRRPRAPGRDRCRRARARVFLSGAPACAATARPAGVLPVSVTAATSRRCRSARPRAAEPTSSVRKRPGGKPGVAQQLLDRERAARHVRGVLQQAGVAGHERRARRSGTPARTGSSRA